MKGIVKMWSRLKKNPLPQVDQAALAASYKTARIANRFNFFGTLNSIIDQTLNLAVHNFTVVDDFWNHTAPYYVMAIYYLMPALMPFIFITYDNCTQKNKVKQSDEVKEVVDLLKALSDIKEFANYLKANPSVERLLFAKLEAFQLNKNYKIDIIINAIYCVLRACHAAIIFLHVSTIASDETSDLVNEGMITASSVISLIYISAMMIHKHYHVKALEEAKKGFQKYNRYFFKAAHAFMKNAKKNEASIALEEVKVDLSEPLLGSVNKP